MLPNGCDETWSEGVIRETKQETTFTDTFKPKLVCLKIKYQQSSSELTAVADEKQFDEIIVSWGFTSAWCSHCKVVFGCLQNVLQ